MSEPKKPLPVSSLQPLRLPITGGDDLNQAIKAAINREAVKLVAELKSGVTTSEDAGGRWLREHSPTKLEGNFPEAAITSLRNALADAWAAGGSFKQLVDAIHSVFADFSEEQATTIAQTAANTAYNVGRDAMAHELGAEEKIWSADGSDACEKCQYQIAAGWIPIDEPFPGGVMFPCLHDGCDCGVNYRQGAPDSFINIDEVKINEVKSMIREGREEEAESVLLGLVAGIEQEAQIHGGRVGSWCYERLAIIYRGRRDYASEIAILTRYSQREANKYGGWWGVGKRLDRARALLAKAEAAAHPEK
jgi:hypothetical protein